MWSDSSATDIQRCVAVYFVAKFIWHYVFIQRVDATFKWHRCFCLAYDRFIICHIGHLITDNGLSRFENIYSQRIRLKLETLVDLFDG